MFRAALTTVAAAVLLLAQIQCAAACAGEICTDAAKSEALPPCHRHHFPLQNQPSQNQDDPASCVHRILSAPAISPQTVQVELPSLAAGHVAVLQVATTVPAETWAGPLGASNFWPPGPEALSSVVLRI